MTTAVQNSGLFKSEPQGPSMTALLAYGALLAAVMLVLAVMLGVIVG